MDLHRGFSKRKTIMLEVSTISQLVPRGKLVNVGWDEIEVWPAHCVNGHNCLQCYVEGKIPCSPRWWRYSPVYTSPQPCLKCGSTCLHYDRFLKGPNKHCYKCLKCGAKQTQGSHRKPEAMKPYLAELWKKGFTKKEIVVRIWGRYGVRITRNTISRIVRSMGGAPREPGWNWVKKV